MRRTPAPHARPPQEALRGAAAALAAALGLLLAGCTSEVSLISEGDLSDGRVVNARIAPVFSQPQFPAPHDAVERALCFSGGGSRALTVTMGVLRALHGLDLMSNVDAISAVSGGSWGTGLYMFSPLPLEELLGPATDPAKLTLEELNKPPPRLGQVVLGEHGEVLKDLVLDPKVDNADAWRLMIQRTLVDELGVPAHDCLAGSQEQVQSIVERNPELSTARFLVPPAERPKVYVVGGALLSPEGYTATAENSVALQMSPDWIGVPFRPSNASVAYTQVGFMREELMVLNVGGGFVETFAFGGLPPRAGQDGFCSGLGCIIPAPPRPWTLADFLGISSVGYAKEITKDNSVLAGLEGVVPETFYWPVLRPGETATVASTKRKYRIGDGGHVENSGIMAMLQRGARKIVWTLSSFKTFPRHLNLCLGGLPEEKAADLVVDQFYDKFGLGEYSVDFLRNNQVFPKAEFTKLLCDFERLVKRGKPVVVRRPQMQVLENKWWGIKSYTVDIVFMYLAPATEFEKLLPAETRSDIDNARFLSKSAEGSFARYPIYDTMFHNSKSLGDFVALTPNQVNLLAAQAEYMVRANRETLAALLG